MARHKPFRDHCAMCGKATDPEIGAHSLIGDGWRLVPALSPEGRETMHWRCPECARKYPCRTT
jgi:hypothetical protein